MLWALFVLNPAKRALRVDRMGSKFGDCSGWVVQRAMESYRYCGWPKSGAFFAADSGEQRKVR